MRNKTMTGAATVALGAVVVAGAGPAFAATTLTQGSALSVPAGACSVTVVSDTEAYTAAHCGAGEWRVGSAVTAATGDVIGTVSALPGTTGVDLVKIALSDDVDVIGDWSTRAASSLAAGETVYTHGSTVPMGSPNSVSHGSTFDIGEVCGDVYTDQVSLDAATTHPGDSGGAVYDAQQRVVGIISGLAPVTFDADGTAVSCDASAMTTIMVPTESFEAVSQTTAPAGRSVASGAFEAAAEKAAAAAAAEKAAAAEAAEVAAAEEAAAEKAAAEKAAAAEEAAAAEAAATATSGVHTYTVDADEAIAQRTRVQADTEDGRFASMTVTSFDADGAVLGSMHLSTQQPMAWINVPATVPAGGHLEIELQDVDGQPTDATVTLGGVAIN